MPEKRRRCDVSTGAGFQGQFHQSHFISFTSVPSTGASPSVQSTSAWVFNKISKIPSPTSAKLCGVLLPRWAPYLCSQGQSTCAILHWQCQCRFQYQCQFWSVYLMCSTQVDDLCASGVPLAVTKGPKGGRTTSGHHGCCVALY